MGIRELSERTGLAKGFLSEVENGRKTASEESADAIARALGVTVEQLCEADPSEPEPPVVETLAGTLSYTPAEAATRIGAGTTETELRRLARRNQVPCHFIGRRMVFTEKDCHAALRPNGAPRSTTETAA